MTRAGRAGLLVAAALAAACVSSAAPRPPIDSRVEADVARSRARVLVELRLPAGMGADPEARRQAIAAVQADALSRLRGTDFVLVRRLETVPLLALEIGPSALAALGTMGDIVSRVVPDTVSAPMSDPKPGRRSW